MTRLRDLAPAALGDAAHELIADRARRLAFATGYDLREGGAGVSDVRWAVTHLVAYARDGIAPEGRPELVGEYLQSLVDVDLVPADLEPEDEPGEGAREAEADVHRVVLAVLARERLREGGPVPSAWLAVLGDVSPARVRQIVTAGELRRWKAGEARDSRRTYVHGEDARRWLVGRGVPGVERLELAPGLTVTGARELAAAGEGDARVALWCGWRVDGGGPEPFLRRDAGPQLLDLSDAAALAGTPWSARDVQRMAVEGGFAAAEAWEP